MRRFLLSLIALLIATVLLVTWIASQERVQDALGQLASHIATTILGRPVQVGWIAWEPLSGSFSAGDLAILGDDGDLLVGVDYISAAIRWGAIAPGNVDFREIDVYGLRSNLEVDADGLLHPLLELTTPTEVTQAVSVLPDWLRHLLRDSDRKPLRVNVDTVRLEDASLRFAMQIPDMEARAGDLDAVIEFEDGRPRSFSLEIRNGYYRILDWSYDDVQMIGGGVVRADGLFFRDLDVQIGTPAIDANVNLDIPFGGAGAEPLVSIDAEAQLDLSLVNLHYTPIPTFLGTADAGVDIAIWEDRGIEMTGRLTADRMLMQGGIVSDLAIDLFLDGDHIEFPSIRAHLSPGGALSGTGTVNWHPDVELAFAVQTSDVVDDWGRAFGGPLPLAPVGRQSGKTVFTMDFDPDWALHLRSAGLMALQHFELLPGSPTDGADVRYRLLLEANPAQVRIVAPQINASWFQATADVTVATTAAGAPFHAAGTAVVTSLERLGLDAVAPVGGSGQGRWGVDAEGVRIQASAAPFRIWQSAWDAASATLDIRDERLSISDIQAFSAAGQVDGRLADDGDRLKGSFRIRTLDVARTLALDDASGQVDGSLRLDWPYRRMALPWLTGDLSLTNLSWRGIEFDDLRARLRHSGRMYGGEVLGADTVLAVGGDTTADLMTIDGRAAVRLPQRIAQAVAIHRLEASPHVRVAGTDSFGHIFARGNGQGNLGAGAFWNGQQLLAWLIGAGDRVQGRGTLRVAERWSAGGELTARLPGTWLDSLGEPGGRLRLLLAGDGLDPQTVGGVVELDHASAALAGIALRQDGRARGRIDHGRLTLEAPLSVTIGSSGKVRLTGQIDTRDLALSLDGSAPLDILALEAVGIRAAAGTVSSSLQLGGTWADPKLYGRGVIEATRLALIDLDEPIEHLAGTFIADGDRLRLEQADAAIGDGTLTIDGELNIFGDDQGRLLAGIRVASNSVRINKKLRTGIDGNVSVEGRIPDDLLLRGEVELSGLRYSDDLTWERLLLQVGSGRTPVPESYHGMGLSLDVRGSRDLQLQTGLLNGGMRLQLRLTGTSVHPVIDGVVELDRGDEFFFRGRIYQIARGSIQFLGDDRNQPFLDVEAETEVRYRGDQGEQSYRIRLLMFGPADQLDVRFESVPRLPEDDILALLSLGILASDLRVDRVDGLELSSILLSQQISEIEREVQLLTGFDRIEIEPAYDNSRGTSSMQVTLEKRLNDRLRLRLSTALDVNADQRVELGYSLLRGIDLSAGWDNRSGGAVGNFYLRPRFVVPLP
ncbi:MAG: hypothetical protein D6761_08340 [Candidatus Dadabacteria bacterium]|nr:MAG: hypothetical protein D6761_08340 [Candidatus Dadabacteria bacterium]